MLCPVAMKISQIASVCLSLLVPVVSACDVDGPPPQTPVNTVVPEPEPVAQTQAPAEDTAGGSAGPQYASQEYALGVDADTYDDNDPSALSDFHGALDAHGAWVDDARYGTVWTPATAEVGADFTPYQTAGHWVVDDGESYVWVSDYDWGWAPFHYGRWVFIEGRGWAWVPGRVYRGAWVGWGWDDGYGYVGWYPLAPTWFWYGGVAVVAPFYVGPRWVYCPRGAVFAPNVGARVIAGPTVAAVAARVHVAATPGVGPAPARLGYASTQVPHLEGPALASVQHAQQYSRPSTAVAMGATPRPAPSLTPASPGSGGEASVRRNGGVASAPSAGGGGQPATGGTKGVEGGGHVTSAGAAGHVPSAPAPATPAVSHAGGSVGGHTGGAVGHTGGSVGGHGGGGFGGGHGGGGGGHGGGHR